MLSLGWLFFIMEGAILISRALIDSEVFASEKLLKIWIWLLIKANFKERQVPIKIGAGQSVVTIKRGQLLFGRLSAENELFIDGSTIYKCIKKLEKLNNIEIKSNSHYSIITICNYDHYQDFKSYRVASNEQASNSQVTATEQPSNTPNNDNNEDYANNEKQLFKEQIFVFSKYSDEMLTKFFDYWTRIEDNGKMKFQNEDQFIISRRLVTWKNYKKPVKKTKLWS
jgi:hypothetical protein